MGGSPDHKERPNSEPIDIMNNMSLQDLLKPLFSAQVLLHSDVLTTPISGEFSRFLQRSVHCQDCNPGLSKPSKHKRYARMGCMHACMHC